MAVVRRRLISRDCTLHQATSAISKLANNPGDLKVNSQSDLHLARRSGGIGPRRCRCDLTEDRRTYQIAIGIRIRSRIVEMGMIEDVVAFYPQLSVHSLGELHSLGKRKIEVDEAWTIEVVPSDVAGTIEGRSAIAERRR